MNEGRQSYDFRTEHVTLKISKEHQKIIQALARDRQVSPNQFTNEIFMIALAEEVARMRKLKGDRWIKD